MVPEPETASDSVSGGMIFVKTDSDFCGSGTVPGTSGIRFFCRSREIRFSRARSERPDQSNFERHCHDFFELLYILRGDGKYVIEGVEYPIRSGMLCLIPPFEYHYVCPKSTSPYERYVLHFDKGILPKTLLQLPQLSAPGGACFSADCIADTPIPAAFSAMERVPELPTGEEQNTLLASSVAQILLLLSLLPPDPPDAMGGAVVPRMIRYLNAHLTDEVSLDLLAQEFFISKYHLCRVFHEQTGVSVFTYFNTKRIALAQKLLADGESATVVAARLGFRDYSTFYRAYKKITGESPVRKL